MFLALGILAVLSVCGVLVSDWPGYQSMRKGAVEEQPQGSMVPPTTNEAMSMDLPSSLVVLSVQIVGMLKPCITSHAPASRLIEMQHRILTVSS